MPARVSSCRLVSCVSDSKAVGTGAPSTCWRSMSRAGRERGQCTGARYSSLHRSPGRRSRQASAWSATSLAHLPTRRRRLPRVTLLRHSAVVLLCVCMHLYMNNLTLAHAIAVLLFSSSRRKEALMRAGILIHMYWRHSTLFSAFVAFCACVRRAFSRSRGRPRTCV